MSLNKLASDIYLANKEKGFWPEIVEDRNTGEAFMLVVSEVAEALESHRVGKLAGAGSALECLEKFEEDGVEEFNGYFKGCIKDTVEDELSDVIIRVLDYCGAHNIDIEAHIQAKLLYNSNRPFKHGKKY